MTSETNIKTFTLIDGQALVQSIGKFKGTKTFKDISDIKVKSNFTSNVLFARYDKTSGTREKRRQLPFKQQHSNFCWIFGNTDKQYLHFL